MKRFIEWDTFEIRVDGTRLSEMVRAIVGKQDPIETISLEFRNGLMRVTGTIRKFVSIPFLVEISEMIPSGTTVRVPLRSASAAGFPLPTILVNLLKNRLPRDLVSLEPPATIVLSLERFLPPFVSADVQKIWIIEGGLAVTLGRGGADLPQPGESHERDDTDGRDDAR